jgi:hypothetical protein
MRHTVPLAALPAKLAFPEQLAGRVGYDDARAMLYFDGVMFKGEFDQLNALSTDWSYRRSLEELFRLSVDISATGTRRKNRKTAAFISLGAVGVLALAWLLLTHFGWFHHDDPNDPFDDRVPEVVGVDQ